MKRGIKNLLVLGLVFGIFLIEILSFISASFELAEGNASYSIESTYAPSKFIRGWINISFENEDVDELISSNFGDSAKLIDFLNENSAVYNCIPNDCNNDYISNNGQDSKSFSLGIGEEEIISFFINEGNINSINELKFDVSVSNIPSCINPLKVDILNDGVIDWKSRNFLNVFSCMYEQGMGCFDSSENSINMRIDSTPYCEKINLIESSNFNLGAWIKNGTTIWHNGLLEMSLYNLDGLFLESCDLPEPSENGREISCIIEYDNDKVQEYYVCIKAEESTDYEIKREDVKPCGFYSFPGEETEYHDYYIFAKSARFANVGGFTFDQEEYKKQGNSNLLNEYIFNYLSSRYNKNCSNGCSIPIKFEAYGNLDIIVSGATLDYSTSAGPPDILHSIYDTILKKAKVNSNFQKLNLEKANLSVPSDIDKHVFELNLNNEQILEQNIEVVAVPEILNIIPNKVPALINVKFKVLLDSTGNLTYVWDFGDDSSKKTSNTNIMEHSYSSLGNYQLKVVVKNKFGNSSKTVQIIVDSPEEHINKTLQDYNAQLNNVQKEIDKLPAWIKKEIEGEIDISNLTSQIKVQEDKYKNALLENDYIKIMTNLFKLKIPDSFGISQTFNPSKIFPSQEQINLNALNYLGVGDIKESKEIYASPITNWIKNNLDINLESKTYSLYYGKEEAPLYSYIKVTLTPKQDLGNVYFLVNRNSKNIKFNNGYVIKEYDETDSGIVFSDMSETKTIEFLYPGKLEIGNFPIYVSPDFTNLEVEVEPGICNFNKRCEKNLKENYKNCRSDCKPLGWTIFWFFILFFIAFIVYIILQEWYKRYYENHLFKNKNQLFNLIHFMNNSFNQGIKKSEIFHKLKNLDWESEQLTYAWRKLNGKRTGMWEIPMFKWVEKRQVKNELMKREGSQINLRSFRV